MKHDLEFRKTAFGYNIISIFVCDMFVTLWDEEYGFRSKEHFQNPPWYPSSLYKSYAYVVEHYDSIIEQAKCILVKEML